MDIASSLQSLLQRQEPVTVTTEISPADFCGHTFNLVQQALHTTGVTLPTVNLTTYDESSYADLVALKTRIQERFDSTLVEYQKPYRQIDKLNKQIIQVRDSKNPSKARLEELHLQVEELHATARAAFPAFLEARRAEEYFRAVPTAYKSDTVGDWFTVLKLALLADGYAPKPFIYKTTVTRFVASN